MKKTILILIFALILILFPGCSQTNDTPSETNLKDTESPGEETPVDPSKNNTTPSAEGQWSIEDYYPFVSDKEYIYEGTGNEYASYNVFTDYFDANTHRVQTRTNNGGTEMVRILENKDGKLSVLLSKEETYYRDNLLESAGSEKEKEILLMEPLVKGTQWTLADNRKRHISETEVEIKTPLETYSALEVTTEGPNGITKDYYAPDVGLVKSIFLFENTEVTSILSEIKEDTPYTKTIEFHYPDVDGKIYVEKKNLSFHTNDISRIKIQEAMREKAPRDSSPPLISKNTKINSLYLGKDNIVYVDLSQEFIDEMNAGAGLESLILQCITNTLGHYYGVARVYLTVDHKLYESGHILLKKGQILKVK